jgi:apolipoprotein N-acyltransferase
MISQSLLQTFIRGQGILDGLRLSSLKGVLARFLLRATFALLSAGLLTCSLPTPDLGWLAWIALVPLLIACAGLSPLQAGTVGFLSGMAANLAIYHWVFAVNGFGIHHFIVLSTFFALFPAAWCAGLSWLNRRQTSLIFAAAALWVLLDYVRAHAGFMAFPWGTLAQTQHQNLALLQLATITGEYGVTFLVVMINVAIFGFVFYGAWRTAVPVVVLVANGAARCRAAPHSAW